VVVQYKRLDEVVGVAAMIRRINDAACTCRGFRELGVLADALDLP
jgi:hypothetical protein